MADKKSTDVIICKAFDLPESPLLSKEARALMRRRVAPAETALKSSSKTHGTNIMATDPRQAERDTFYASEQYQQLRQRYPVSIETTTIADVTVEIFTPLGGVSQKTKTGY